MRLSANIFSWRAAVKLPLASGQHLGYVDLRGRVKKGAKWVSANAGAPSKTPRDFTSSDRQAVDVQELEARVGEDEMKKLWSKVKNAANQAGASIGNAIGNAKWGG